MNNLKRIFVAVLTLMAITASAQKTMSEVIEEGLSLIFNKNEKTNGNIIHAIRPDWV